MESEDLIDSNLIITICLTVIGLFGNLLATFIFSRKKFTEIAMFRYLISVNICNMINLLFVWPLNYPDLFKMTTNLISCKLIMYLSTLFYSLNPWLLLSCSLDRMLLVLYPHKFHFRKHLKYQLLEIIVFMIFMILTNIPIYVYFDLIQSSNSTSCGYTDIIPITLDIYVSLVSVIIPSILMILSTSMVGYRLVKKKTLLQRKKERYNKDKKLIFALIAIDLFYFICNLPYSVFLLYYDFFHLNPFIMPGYNFFNNLTTVYNAFSFFTYFLSNSLVRNYILQKFYSLFKNTTRIHPA